MTVEVRQDGANWCFGDLPWLPSVRLWLVSYCCPGTLLKLLLILGTIGLWTSFLHQAAVSAAYLQRPAQHPGWRGSLSCSCQAPKLRL